MDIMDLRQVRDNNYDRWPLACYIREIKTRLRTIYDDYETNTSMVSFMSGVDRHTIVSMFDPENISIPQLRPLNNICVAFGIDVDKLLTIDGFVSNVFLSDGTQRIERPHFKTLKAYDVFDKFKRASKSYRDLVDFGHTDELITMDNWCLYFSNRIYEDVGDINHGELANALDIPRRVVDDYIYGTTMPSIVNLVNLAYSMNVPISYLILTNRYVTPRTKKQKFVDYFSVSRGLKDMKTATSYIDVIDEEIRHE